jgi:hypothetical protein
LCHFVAIFVSILRKKCTMPLFSATIPVLNLRYIQELTNGTQIRAV